MGKIRTRMLGLEDIEKQQKVEQKKRSEEKKMTKKPEEETVAEEPKETKKVEAKPQKKAVAETATKKHIRGSKHQKAQKAVNKDKFYVLDEAVTLLKKIKYVKFDESVELHLNVLETGLKGEVELPHTTGKTVKVKIVDDALLENLDKGIIDFDILVAHPSFMSKLAKHARVLGPKGLMPNPKAGTVSPNPEAVAKKFEKGTLRWKTEAKFPLVHQLISKISADNKAIIDNATVFIQSVGTKNIKQAVIKSTMSPGLKIDITQLV